MNLYFLRHGIAVDRDPKSFPDDSRRPLTLKGEDRIRLICGAIQRLDISFDYILSSPFLRTRQTTDIVASEMNLRNALVFCDELKPGGEMKSLLRRISQLSPKPENVLLVGHQPDLSQIISMMISGSNDTLIDLKKGGFAKLEVDQSLRPTRCATLAWSLTPKQMTLMAKGNP